MGLRGHMMPRSEHGWQKLQALVVAIDAAAMREPYPRLAKLMQSLAMQHAGAASPRPAYS